MTRMYLSPEATVLAKIGLVFVEMLIGIFNIVTWPIRIITLKSYALIVFGFSALYLYFFGADLTVHLVGAGATLFVFTIGIFAIRALHKYLNQTLSPKVAMMINSPLGIQLNRFYR